MVSRFGYVSLEELLEWVRAHPLPSGRILPVCVWGAKGIGKTQQIRAFAEARGLDMVTYHPAHDSQGSDIVGIPYIDEENRKTVYAKPEWLPNEAGNGGVLFIDEINRAKLEVIQGLMEVLGEGEISQSGWKLPEGWQVVAAANPAGKDYAVSVLDDAMINRMINYAPGFDAPGWVRWAEGAGVSQMVVDVALQNPDLVDSGESDLPFEVRPSATARSLEYLAALYEQGMEPRMLDTIAQGLVGKQMAEAMIEQHFESERAMTGIEIAQGGWEETVERWIADGRDDYIRASGERLIALLGNGDPGRSRIAKVAVQWMQAIPEDLQREFIRVLAESSPPWFAFFMENPDLGAAQMIPENLASLRKPSNRQMVGRRQARSEARRQAERIAREMDQAAAPMADDIPGDIPGDIPLTSF